MTRSQLYRKIRIERGTQCSVAALLGVDPQTLSRRERGEIAIPDEALIALKSLPKLKEKKP
jgi:transcriptional regulator with XRE-family HTH domain